MKLWITGGQGMLGTCLQRLCRDRNIVHLASPRHEADLTDLASLISIAQRIEPSHMINCAAYTDVDRAEGHEQEATAINATGARNLALAAVAVGARLVHISTDYVFNGLSLVPYRETDLCAPINVYGRSKWEGEKGVLEVFPSACILRTSWLFGAQGRNFVSSVIKWLYEKQEFQAVDDQSARPTYVHDLARAVVDLLDCEGIIHFANGGVASRYQVAIALREELLRKGHAIVCRQIHPVSRSQFPTPAPRPIYSALATDTYTQITGKQPRPWKEAMEDYLTHAITS